jgi:hypothetical protein
MTTNGKRITEEEAAVYTGPGYAKKFESWIIVQIDAWSGKQVDVTGGDKERFPGRDDDGNLLIDDGKEGGNVGDYWESRKVPPPPTRRTDGNGMVKNFPKDPIRPDDYSFNGWITRGGTVVTKNTVFTTNTRVFAKWKAGGTIKYNPGLVETEFTRITKALKDGTPLSPGKPDEVTVTITATESFKPITLALPSGSTRHVTIILEGPTAGEAVERPYLTVSENGSLFTLSGNVTRTWDPTKNEYKIDVKGSVTLELRNARMQGHDRNTQSILTVNAGGKVIIGENKDDKSYITLNTAEKEMFGGGVTVNQDGYLEMNGGDISSCLGRWDIFEDLEGYPGGGGVYLRGGTFVMNGGKIERCSGRFMGGAVFVDLKGKFTMKGGQLYNSSAPYGGGVTTFRGGLFIMEDGIIEKCIAREGAGVFVFIGAEHKDPYDPRRPTNFPGMTPADGWPGFYDPTKRPNDERRKEGFYFHGGAIHDNESVGEGGGIANYAGGIVYMQGKYGKTPTISNNIAAGFGGGVDNAGLFIMMDGKIHNNRARYGGGVASERNQFVMESGAITNNWADGYGGGVFAFEGIFAMMGGTIGGATAYNRNGSGLANWADSMGGGVAVYPTGNFAMAGGKILRNEAYSTLYGMIGFFSGTDPKFPGLAWYGKRPIKPGETGPIPGDPDIVSITHIHKYPSGVQETLLDSYLTKYVRDLSTHGIGFGLVQLYLVTYPFSNQYPPGVYDAEGGFIVTTSIEVTNEGKLLFDGQKPSWVTYSETYPDLND